MRKSSSSAGMWALAFGLFGLFVQPVCATVTEFELDRVYFINHSTEETYGNTFDAGIGMTDHIGSAIGPSGDSLLLESAHMANMENYPMIPNLIFSTFDDFIPNNPSGYPTNGPALDIYAAFKSPDVPLTADEAIRLSISDINGYNAYGNDRVSLGLTANTSTGNYQFTMMGDMPHWPEPISYGYTGTLGATFGLWLHVESNGTVTGYFNPNAGTMNDNTVNLPNISTLFWTQVGMFEGTSSGLWMMSGSDYRVGVEADFNPSSGSSLTPEPSSLLMLLGALSVGAILRKRKLISL